MTMDYCQTGIVGMGDIGDHARQPVHLHLRTQQGLYALYVTPLSLRLCIQILREYLQGRYVLLLSLSGVQVAAQARLSLAQWLRQQGIQAHSVRSAFALVPAQQIDLLTRLPYSQIAFTDTSLSPDEVVRVQVEQVLQDTFASPRWHEVILPELDNQLYCESREDRFTQVLCSNRQLLANMISCCLRICLQSHLPEFPAIVEDFPPLIHEQLWQYTAQGLAPLSAGRTADGVEMHVALGTPDRSACVMAQSCPHVSQIQRGFILRWCGDGGWKICSTEEVNSVQPW
ncbi:MAG: hypothetical protein RMM08_06785 [Armatimonadota bacterium]|nr:hypothetical protein [bacterium]MDW8321049.1 hypothetical protein [Armatimonadota bacterium]